MRGVLTVLPALSPTQAASRSDGKRSAVADRTWLLGATIVDTDDMDDDDVFRAVAERVAACDYLDAREIRPGTLTPDGTWVVTSVDDDDTRWVEPRGSSKHLAALAAGAVDALPPLRPASSRAVEEAEHRLGHPLPPLLRRLYLQVANGGFGPGTGVLGLAGGHRDDLGRTALDRLDLRDPPGLLPLDHWGCAIYSYVDCANPGAQMWGFDPHSGLAEHSFYPEGFSLTEWLRRWLHGNLRQPYFAFAPAPEPPAEA